jgi:hypothetical protein
MSASQKKVFLSYRRSVGAFVARAVWQHLTKDGAYDVFIDVESLDSGEFPSVILHQIEARPHFVIALVPGSLERTLHEGDWLRREIEHALQCERNIVPLLAEGFSFESEESRLQGKLPPTVKTLSRHNAINVHAEYFLAAMDRLTNRFLKKEVKVAITPTPDEEVSIVQRMLTNAARATPEAAGTWAWRTKEPLTAPTLSEWNPIIGCTWTSVLGATGYVLEKSTDRSFKQAVTLYEGERTGYLPSIYDLPSVTKPSRRRRPSFTLDADNLLTPPASKAVEYYRVKAKGGFAFLDGPWSNVVATGTELVPRITSNVFASLLPPLDAPVLEKSGPGWTWTAVKDAVRYVLESSDNLFFLSPRTLYTGPETRWKPPTLGQLTASSEFALPSIGRLNFPPKTQYYRVKAVAGLGASDSPWSDVVQSP